MFLRYKFDSILIIFAVLYALIIGMLFGFYRELAIKDAKKEALHILDTMNAVRDYVSMVQRPLIDELKELGVINKELFDPRLQSSSYIARNIYEIQLLKHNIGYNYKVVATDPLNPAHVGNEFENEILEGFKEGKYNSFSKIIKDKNTSYVFVGLPIKNSQASCVACHNINSAPKKMIEQYGDIGNFQGKVGDTIAMATFKVPVKSILLSHTKEFLISAIILLCLISISVFCIYKIYEKVVKIKKQNELLMISQNRLATMGEMIGNISHQWKQPLAQISSALINLELFSERGKLDNKRLNQKLAEIDEQVKFMSETIDDFKNFFNPNTPKCDFTAGEAIVKACKILNSDLKKSAIDIQIDIKSNFNLNGNINELIQILINIINNAKEALLSVNLASKKIKISLKQSQNERAIEIYNNGPQISQDIIDRIFQPHFTTKTAGSGLGLYMSKFIMQKNGGEIEAANLNDGVLFTIKFF